MKRWRSKKYIKWVKTLPCYLCRAPSDDPHHIKGTGNLSGFALTAPDQFAIPTCRGCHQKWHEQPALWPEQWEAVARTLAKAMDEGVLVMIDE